MDCICDKFVMVEDGEVFEMSQAAKGDPGPGVAPGGTTGQILAKASDTDYDTEWIDAPDMDAGGVTYDPTEAYDDGTVGKELGTINSALSSLSSVTEIIDTASGAIASFPDGAGTPMRSLLAQIEPQQNLHGYDAPWAAGTGLNKLTKATLDDSKLFGITVTIADDGGITLNGTPTSNATVTVPFDPPLPAGNYTWFIFNPSTSESISVSLRDGTSNKSLLSGSFQRFSIENVVQPITIAEAAYYWRFQVNANTALTNFTFKPMLCVGTVASATYAPYVNICPITGWTGLSGERDGANLWDEQWEGGDISAETGINEGNAQMIRAVGYIPVDASKTYYFFCGSITETNVRARFYDQNKAYIGYSPAGKTFVYANNSFTPPSGAYYMRFAMQAVYGATYKNDISVNYPATVTTYNAYTSLPITCTWQTEAGTVYGGTVDVVTGVLTVDRVIIEYVGASGEGWTYSPTWSTGTNTNAFYNTGILRDALYTDYDGIYCISNLFPAVSRNTLASNDVPSIGYSGTYGAPYVSLRVLKSVASTAQEFKTWLQSNNLQVVYLLATPQTYQLTPQQILTLLGNNTVFVDCGSVSVTYQASIKGYIDKVLAS